jgi:GT2 family glycosyltransferase
VPTTAAVSAVICTRDRPQTIHLALAGLAAQSRPPFEVLVVDQSTDDSAAAAVRELVDAQPSARYLRVPGSGKSRSCNAAVREARTELLAFTDDDCVPRPDWVATVERCLAEQPDVDLVYGQVLLPADLARRENRDGVTPMLPIPQRRRLSRTHGFYVFGMGANVAFRKAIHRRVGGFDELLCAGGPLKSAEDFDFAYRVYLAAGTILLEPDLVVEHHGWRELAAWPRTMGDYGFGDGAFYLKHLRAGDARAARMLAGVLVRGGGRVARRLLRRQPVAGHAAYLRGVLAGMRRSLAFPVDREARLYRSV